MNETAKVIIVNVIASALWVLVGVFATTIYYFFIERIPLKKVWGLHNRSEDVFMAITDLAPQKAAEYNRPTTGIGELEAVSFVRESLVLGYPRQVTKLNMVFSTRFPDTGLSGDIISIGGSKHNEITRLMVRDISFPLDFIYEPVTAIVDRASNKVYHPKLDSLGVISDYGLIVRMPNPLAPERIVFLLRGAHTYGVAGCGKMLTPPYVKQISKQLGKIKSPFWQALVAVKCIGYEVFPELILIRPLSRADVLNSHRS